MCSNENGLRPSRPLKFESLEVRRVFAVAPIAVDLDGSQKSGETVSTAAWTNQASPTDVNGDGHLSSLDALQVINAINHYGHQELEASNIPEEMIVDANLDRCLSSLDVLAIVNQINAEKQASSQSTTQAPTPTDQTAALNAATPAAQSIAPAIDQSLQSNVQQGSPAAMVVYEKAELDGKKFDIDDDGFITPRDIDQVIQHLAADNAIVSELSVSKKPFDYLFYEKATGNLAYLELFRDGFISSKDIELKILQVASENPQSETEHATGDRFDINQDGVVNTDDAMEVLKRVFAYNALVPCTCAQCLANALAGVG